MTVNCKGKLIDLSRPKVMGILNITPDSFYDGGKFKTDGTILKQVEKMLSEGATFIDIGAYSSRPGADEVTEQNELSRILPSVQLILKEFPDCLISIDTFRSSIADKCLNAGAVLINDISAGMLDTNMLQTVSDHNVPLIMMHMRGTPKNMQQHTEYKNLTIDLLAFFSERMAKARSLHINDILIDPGFGFAKNLDQNYTLLQQLEVLKTLDLPLLIGLSRKSMIYKVLEGSAKDALNGTTALNMVALQKGANILRVHDVKEAMECIKLAAHLA